MKNVPSLVVALLGVATAACLNETRTDVSGQTKFKHLVGTEYEVVGPVDAYGIRNHPHGPVESVTLIPPPGIGGRYVAFRTSLQPGSRVLVQRVLKTNRWPDPDMSYDVLLKGTPLPTTAQVEIDLFRGNESKVTWELNPKLYRKVN